VAVGAKDSPQATLIPLYFLAEETGAERDFEVVEFDTLHGKHGDHIGANGMRRARCCGVNAMPPA
jgi:ABC-type phosphate/phosphonate transport system substrate-binding protein